MAAAILAFASVAFDKIISDPWLRERAWVYSGGADGARAVLGTVASSMMTITGIVFSMVLVALSLASTQFGPRLLRNFMRDTINQVVLGAFVATFLYTLLVLRTIHGEGDNAFVPQFSVTMGVMFALVSLGFLIYFIHHVSISIQADQIISRVGVELNEGIERIFPEHVGRDANEVTGRAPIELPDAFDVEATPVKSKEDGYVQFIDADALIAIAKDADAVIKIVRRPGQFVVRGFPLVRVWPAGKQDDKLAARVRNAFALGNERSPGQDVEYAVHQLVEVASRALSPGVNDPFTAITCIDRLSASLSRLVKREMPTSQRFDVEDQLRVVAPLVSFPDIADAAFNQIRQYARSSAAVTIRLLEAITTIAVAAQRPEDRVALQLHADMIVRSAREGLPEEEDRRVAEGRYDDACRALREGEEFLR